MDTVQIDLSGPYQASMAGLVYLIMFVDNASRWIPPYDTKRASETNVRLEISDRDGWDWEAKLRSH